MQKLSKDEAEAIGIILIVLLIIVIVAAFSKPLLKALKGITGQSEEAEAAKKEEASREEQKKAEDKKTLSETVKKGSPLTLQPGEYIARAKTIEENGSYDTLTALNRDLNKVDNTFTSTINSDADFDALVVAYGSRPLRSLFGSVTSVKMDLLTLLRSIYDTGRIDRTNKILAAKKVNRRI